MIFHDYAVYKQEIPDIGLPFHEEGRPKTGIEVLTAYVFRRRFRAS